MKYEAITEADRNGLLHQRLAQHEQMYFELDIQLTEIDELILTLEDDELRKAEAVRNNLQKSMREVACRIETVRNIMVKPGQENAS